MFCNKYKKQVLLNCCYRQLLIVIKLMLHFKKCLYSYFLRLKKGQKVFFIIKSYTNVLIHNFKKNQNEKTLCF